ncbi:hypothetical protein D7X55_05135 [Corallococcus sp. AB049A]|uniref:hypothetical protein n=1 Tax=Corallococcus sp. AB049A TaxID=2316721 RepID=UPI000EC4813C|nr:hypothetical protein [Corallococcus sp. AB049A]RKI73518.1 hypothetical protein D7X55_05135 [Corallococcus sp. AB049A]
MLAIPFLTQLDSRAAVKGSRDPLGVQPIWSRFGRRVVGNLTTVSNSVTDFTVLLLGYYFAERVAAETQSADYVTTFLKWEQLAAYARASRNNERSFRGTERVAFRLAKPTVEPLGTDSDAQILSNQKIYGLWGLYSVPAKASGLLEGSPVHLTPVARHLVEKVHLPLLEAVGPRGVRGLVERLGREKDSIDLREGGRDQALLDSIARVLGKLRAPERMLYREHLLQGGPGDRETTQGLQQVFADVLESTLDDAEWRLTPESLQRLAWRAREQGSVGERLANRLERIRACELLIAPAVALFEHTLRHEGQTVQAIAQGIQELWGAAPRETIDLGATEEIELELRAGTGEPESGARWMALARALHTGDYAEAIRLVLEQNATIMNARGDAAPWARIVDGKLHVNLRDDSSPRSPSGEELPLYWRHAYFIESLRNVASALRA